jgi:hypothetical protein
MLTRNAVVAWAAGQCGPARAEQRVIEGPAAFLVNMDMTEPGEITFGGGTWIVVRKRTGEFWHIANDPESAFVHTAKNDRRLRRAIRKVVPFSKRPAGVVSGTVAPAPDAGLTREQVGAWLRVTRGWEHIDRRIADLGWAFSVDTQPDAVLDGNSHAMTYGNGPLIVAKRTGEVWALSSAPNVVPAFTARDQDEFLRFVAEGMPFPGSTLPTERVPL